VPAQNQDTYSAFDCAISDEPQPHTTGKSQLVDGPKAHSDFFMWIVFNGSGAEG
jgi:hypothetical protein